MNQWPLQSQAINFYGNPLSANWLHTNTVDVRCPWTLHMDTKVLQNILIHKKCAESLERVLNAVWEACGKSQAKIESFHYDRYSGSYNYRPMRGGHAVSMHGFAAAIDWDAGENEQHSQRHLFKDDSLLIVKFKEEGWIWGGDWSPGSIDAMHVQAARVHP